ncbi:MAG TPA: shikimate kinase AroK [Rhodanobacteraceae bacterium]|nr:shikimate kinase AroK [Rhodanobacteraceae bacterium]
MNPSPNLFLIGPMGAGKSSIGRRLAQHFDMPCIDLDSAIEEHTGVSVATIFEVEGEQGFRRRESELLAELTARCGIVLATGGGAVLAAANRRLLRDRGFVVWLETGVEQQMQRLARDRKRPLLDTPDRRGRLEQLARERDPLYRELANFTVQSGGESCRASAARIAESIQRHWQRLPITQEST